MNCCDKRQLSSTFHEYSRVDFNNILPCCNLVVLVNYTVYLLYLPPRNFISIGIRTVVFLSGQFSNFFQRSTFYRGVVLPRGLLHRRVSLDLGERAASFRRAGAHPRNGPTFHVLRCFSYRLLPTNNGCGQSSCSTSYDIRQYVVMFMNVCVCVCVSLYRSNICRLLQM